MNNEELVKLIFELVMKEIAKLEAEQSGGTQAATVGTQAASNPASSPRGAASMEMNKKVLSESDVKLAHRNGACEIIVSRKAIVTCLAAEYAVRRGITITRKA